MSNWFRDLFKGKERTAASTAKQEVHNECPYLFDAGNYGGVRYWCNNSTNPGLLGQGTRIPLTDIGHMNTYCKQKYKRCPLMVTSHMR